jgi:hypothetical protein
MSSTRGTETERIAINLSLREWLVVLLIVTVLAALLPLIPYRPRRPLVDGDYRIPYALSNRYDLYRRFTNLSASQFPTILVGDSVVWGQFTHLNGTLAHHLNALTKQRRYINAGLDGMHPIALAQLLEHHAPAIQKKDVVLQFNPLWLMMSSANQKLPEDPLLNRPGLVPRLAAGANGTIQDQLEAIVARLFHGSPFDWWGDRIADSRVDFLAWSLDHPYESPLKAISSGLPPSEDSYNVRMAPWAGIERAKLDARWPVLETNGQWKAFERVIDLLEARHNRVMVLLGPMNEHMMTKPMLDGYLVLKRRIQEKIEEREILCFMAPTLESNHYSDICHPLASGYEELARELLKSQSPWLLGVGQSR